MEIYILENFNSFNLTHVFECGQCFRWNKNDDGSFTGVVKHTVINVKEDDGRIIFTGVCKDGNFKNFIKEYFDMI